MMINFIRDSKRFFPLTVLFLIALLFFAGCKNTPASSVSTTVKTAVQVQANAPEFSADLLSGGKVTLTELKSRGTPLLVNFGSSWCDSCRREAPILEAAFEKYKDRVGFLVTISKQDYSPHS